MLTLLKLTQRNNSLSTAMKFFRVAFFLLTFAAATHGSTLSGTVRDSEGAVIANARVTAHWDAAGSNYLGDNTGNNEDVTATTDSSGHFSIELPPGFYDVFVTAHAFTPHCEKIRLKVKQTLAYDVELKVSPLTSKKLD